MPYSPENISTEKQERQEKCEKILSIINSLAKSLTNSIVAYELGISITNFMDGFNNDKENKSKNLKLQDYSLGAALLFPADVPNILENILSYQYDDIKDGEIEKFIRKLYKQQEKNQKTRKIAA